MGPTSLSRHLRKYKNLKSITKNTSGPARSSSSPFVLVYWYFGDCSAPSLSRPYPTVSCRPRIRHFLRKRCDIRRAFDRSHPPPLLLLSFMTRYRVSNHKLLFYRLSYTTFKTRFESGGYQSIFSIIANQKQNQKNKALLQKDSIQLKQLTRRHQRARNIKKQYINWFCHFNHNALTTSRFKSSLESYRG